MLPNSHVFLAPFLIIFSCFLCVFNTRSHSNKVMIWPRSLLYRNTDRAPRIQLPVPEHGSSPRIQLQVPRLITCHPATTCRRFITCHPVMTCHRFITCRPVITCRQFMTCHPVMTCHRFIARHPVVTCHRLITECS